MGEAQTLYKSNHSVSGLNLSLLFRFCGPVLCVHLLLGIAEWACRTKRVAGLGCVTLWLNGWLDDIDHPEDRLILRRYCAWELLRSARTSSPTSGFQRQ